MLVKIQNLRIDYTEIESYEPQKLKQIRIMRKNDIKPTIITYSNQADRDQTLEHLDVYIGIACCN